MADPPPKKPTSVSATFAAALEHLKSGHRALAIEQIRLARAETNCQAAVRRLCDALLILLKDEELP